MKKCLFTVNFGNYDKLKEPYITKGWDYFVFTNNKLHKTKWNVKHVNIRLSNHLAARYVYINSNVFVPDYDFSIMIGGQISIDNNLDDFVSEYIDMSKDINIMKHPCRTCIYKEAEIVIRENIAPKEEVNPQMERYRKEGMPENFGLVAAGIIARHKKDNIAQHEKLWWNEVKNNCHRDQLSFDYVRWKHNLCTYNYMPYQLLWSKYFSVYQHGTGRKL